MVPLEHVFASVTTYPFWGERVFANSGRDSSCLVAKNWQLFEAETGLPWPGFSIDELVAIRDQFWCCHEPKTGDRWFHQWKGLCRQVLVPRGPYAIPAIPVGFQYVQHDRKVNDESQARTLWRWLTFCVPEDWLLFGAWTNQQKPLETQIVHRELSKSMARQGFAETHLHLGAAIKFPDLWISAMRTIGKATTSREIFYSSGGVFQGGRNLADWLLRAAIVRVILAHFLAESSLSEHGSVTPQSQRTSSPNGFRDFVNRKVLTPVAIRCGNASVAFLRMVLDEVSSGQLRDTPSGVLTSRESTKDSSVFRELQSIYRQLVGPGFFQSRRGGDDSQTLRSESLKEARSLDPICGYFRSDLIPAEMQFWEGAFQFLQSVEPRETSEGWDFSNLFWQTLRIRNIYYRHLVLRPGVPGLSWFIRSYNRIWAGASSLSERAKLESAASVSGQGKGLVSLEVRAGFNESIVGLRRFVNSLERSSWDLIQDQDKSNGDVRQLAKVSLVLHFIRERGPNYDASIQSELGRGTYADPEFSPNGQVKCSYSACRYGLFFQKLERQTRAATRLIRENPSVLRFLRAIDCCNDETAIPLWIVAPHMKYVREVSRHVASRSQLMGEPLSPLHTTIHVAEDFIYPLSGLRRTGEALEHLCLEESDRLGHALALGIDVKAWANERHCVLVPLEDRLFDLVWEWNLYRDNKVYCTANRLSFVEGQIFKLSGQLFQDAWIDEKRANSRDQNLSIQPLRLEDISTMVAMLFQIGDFAYQEPEVSSEMSANRRHFLRRLRFPAGIGQVGRLIDAHSPPSIEGLLHTYLTSPACFRAARTGVWVDLSGEIESMESIQEWLKHDINSRRLLIEINPSCNLVVGDLRALYNHPVVRLAGGSLAGIDRQDAKVSSPLSVSMVVGSDDPIVFGCALREEYGLLLDALDCSPSLTSDSARSFLDRLMKASLDASF
jgi:hypothetical protein